MTYFLGPNLDRSGEPYPLLNLGDQPDPSVRRDNALDVYGVNREAFTPGDDPLDDIARIKQTALTPYVSAVLPRMRTGEVVIMDEPKGSELPTERLYSEIERANGHSFGELVVRRCSAERVPLALQTGSDRNRESGVNRFGPKWGGGTFENLSMQEFGLDGQYEDVTYGSILGRRNLRHVVTPGNAELVYVTPGLQAISHRRAYVHDGPWGFMAFIDPRLKAKSLVAVIHASET
jgi:hypothetical protein